ncbi:MAG: UDP-N-acetylmuramoyl-tripeptide--D-alanyl-D-alanine ligase [Actinomycetia bacterium]|nr:UDP-N-acetylmuramoyl-tripeptide--D-alanyl-D-alanine ligase [Actinomycetes bacterium]
MEVTTLGSVAAMVGGTVDAGSATVEVGPDVVVDSRLATPGALFVALAGERTDGHRFVPAALEAGAAGALVDHDPGPGRVLVTDTGQALADLAREVVAAAEGLTVTGITGSSGKTSTKDLLAQLLETAGETVAPQGSFNNEIGVPLTALRVRPGTSYLVSEMGARGLGHIHWLCSLVRPQVGVVLNVGSAHVGEFGSVEQIATAKAELVQDLPATGWAVLSADDSRVAAMAELTSAQVAWFSAAADPGAGALRVWASDQVADPGQRYGFVLHVVRGEEHHQAPVRLQVSGEHQVANAVAAAAAALAVGLGVQQVAEALSRAVARSRWRMEIEQRADQVTVVNDAYNANPDSMRAAIRSAGRMLQAARQEHPGAKLFAVLGEMLELGRESAAAHLEVGRLAAEEGASVVLGIGDHAEQIVAGAAGAGADAVRLDSREQAVQHLQDLRPGDVVLVKASRGIGLEKVAESLLGASC